MSHRGSKERLPRGSRHEHSETSWQDSATEGFPVKLVMEVVRVGNDVVSTACTGGQHKEVFDRITGQRLDPVGVENARAEDVTHMRGLNVCGARL